MIPFQYPQCAICQVENKACQQLDGQGPKSCPTLCQKLIINKALKAYGVDKKFLFTYSGYCKNDLDELDRIYTVNYLVKHGPAITYTEEGKLLPARIDAVCFVTVGGAKRWFPAKGKIEEIDKVYIDGISPKRKRK